MFDMQKMLQQAQRLQQDMQSVQDELETIEVTGQANNGDIKIVADAKLNFKSVTIAPGLAASASAEELSDLMLVALKDLNNKASEVTRSKMEAVTNGLKIPGLKLPF